MLLVAWAQLDGFHPGFWMQIQTLVMPVTISKAPLFTCQASGLGKTQQAKDWNRWDSWSIFIYFCVVSPCGLSSFRVATHPKWELQHQRCIF